jgi:heat shock protein HslJ
MMLRILGISLGLCLLAGAAQAEAFNGDFAVVKIAGVKTVAAKAGLSITPGGNFQASAGCNQMIGTAKLGDKVISFGPLAGTKTQCAPAAMAAEKAFTSALSKVSAWKQKGKDVELLAGGKMVILLRQK